MTESQKMEFEVHRIFSINSKADLLAELENTDVAFLKFFLADDNRRAFDGYKEFIPSAKKILEMKLEKRESIQFSFSKANLWISLVAAIAAMIAVIQTLKK